MDRLHAMGVFLAVADRQSFAEAARALRLSPAKVSRVVAALETDLGLALLHRTTRTVRLTERGALYADRCRRILADVEEAGSLARGQDAAPRGLLTVTAPVVFGRLHVLPALERLMGAHPALTVRLALMDRVAHLVEEGFDVAIRIGALPDSALVAAPVARVRPVVVASPAYLEVHGQPETPADLKRHRIIGFEGVGATDDWRFGDDGKASVTVSPRLSVNSADAAIASALRGLGVTRALSYQVDEAVAGGKLVRLLQAHEPPELPVSVLYQAARRGHPNVRAFVAAVQHEMRSRPAVTAAPSPATPAP